MSSRLCRPLTCFLVSLVSVGRLALLARRRLWVVAPAFCSLLRSEWKSPTRLVHPTLYLPVRGTREVREVAGCPWAPGGITAAKGQNLSLSTRSNPKSITQDWLCESGQVAQDLCFPIWSWG